MHGGTPAWTYSHPRDQKQGEAWASCGSLAATLRQLSLQPAVDVRLSEPINRTLVQLINRLTARFPVTEPLRLHEQYEMFAVVQCQELGLASDTRCVEQDRADDLPVTLILDDFAKHRELRGTNIPRWCNTSASELNLRSVLHRFMTPLACVLRRVARSAIQRHRVWLIEVSDLRWNRVKDSLDDPLRCRRSCVCTEEGGAA